jgi:autotransporter-associated beta strand protein
MKPRILSTARLAVPLATAIAALLAVQSASATNYYWDVNGTTAGFSTVVGAWNGTNAFWGPNSSGTGGTYIAAPTTSDDLFITPAATNTGSITISGTQNAGSLTFGNPVGVVTLTSGTLNMGATATINANNWNSIDVIATAITGASTSLTKIGNGALTLQGANTFTGETILNGYWGNGNGITIISGVAGTINTSSGITINGTTLTLTNATTQGAVDRLNNSAASLITSNGGILNYGNANTAGNTYAETAGTLTLTRGQFNTVLTTDQAASIGQTLTFGGLTQAGTSAVTFSAAATGPQASGLKNMIVVTGAGTSAFIAPWATVGTTTALQTDYAAYNADYVVPANITASAESTWITSTDAYTSSGSTALSGDRTMAALRNTGATATITLSDGTTGYKLATNGILNGVTTVLTIAPGTVEGSVTAPGASGGNLFVTPGSGAITINAPINDNGGAVTLVKNGSLVLSLGSATSNYSGDTVINGGALNFVTGSLGTTGNIRINSVANIGTNQAGAARLQWGLGTTTDLSSRLTMVNSGYAILDTGGNTVTFSNAIGSSSSSGLGKTGAGTLNLNGINTFTGATDVYAGTLVLGAANASTSIRVGNATPNGGTAGAFLKLGASNLLSSNAAIIVDGQNTNTLDLQGFNQTVGNLFLGSNSGGAGNYGTVTGSGSSTLTLTNGVTGDAHNQGANAFGGGSISVPFLDLNNATQNFSLVGSADATRGALVISSVIQNGGLNRTGSIAGILSLTNANTFSGATTISDGVLRLDNSLALQNSALDTAASTTGDGNNGLRLNTGVTTLTLGGLNGNKNFAATGGVFSTTSNNYASVTALTLNPGSGTASFSGVIANGAAGMTLTKSGAGTQALSNTNIYTGATTVSGGALLVNSPGSLNAASAVTVGTGSGGTLGGNGTINGSVTIAADGSLAPGAAAAAGTLSIGGTLDISAQVGGSGKLKFDLDALANPSDQIAVTGTLTIGTGALGFTDFVFTNLGGLQVTGGTPYKLITSGGITALNTLDPADLSGSLGGGFTGTLQITGNDLELVVTSGGNTAPTISAISNLSVPSGGNTGPLAFTVGDAETPGSLTVTGSSSNPTLVPNANIVVVGSGASRSVTVTPVSGLTGTATITLTVSDGSLTADEPFTVTVTGNYTSWAASQGISGEPATGDYDKDGLSNLVEYALGKDPKVSSSPAGVLSGYVITYTKGTEAIANGDVSWAIETSTDLGATDDWTTSESQPAGDPALTISHTFTPSTPVKDFARLKVTQQP